MKKNTLHALLLGSAVLLSGIGIRQTYSYFTQKEIVNNVFTVGNLEIDFQEPEWDPTEGDGKDVYPGYTVYKNPTVKNLDEDQDHSQPCYLKMRVRILDEEGNLISEKERLDLIRKTIRYDSSYSGNIAEKGEATGLIQGYAAGYTWKEMKEFPMVNPDFDLVREEGGVLEFGYHGGKESILQTGEETVLFTHVVFPTDWTNTEMEKIGQFQLEISAEAIQANGFTDRESAFLVLEEK